MSTTPEHTHHAFDYIELTVANMEAAKQFYSVAFGWQFNDYGPEYAGIQTPGPSNREQGGLRVGEATRSPATAPLVILYSENLDATLASVRNAGGVITQEPFDFPGGRRFHFEDPSGNPLAVWSER